jgi:putative Mg2+ transporter-C (MgtC) family protein
MVTVALRLILSLVFGGLIGLERGRQRRAAGLRTHILVCVGAALTVMVGFFAREILDITNSDPLRVSAQVISGIGFLGVGTIMVKGRFQIVGLTTAAGLWACACMGLCIGAAFHECAIIACVMIWLTISYFTGIEKHLISTSQNMNINVVVADTSVLPVMFDIIRDMDIKIYDSEITNMKNLKNESPNVLIEMRMPKRRRHSDVIATIASIDGVLSIEED